MGFPIASAAQLRPLEPLDWNALDEGRTTVALGAGVYAGQRASLAGTEGRLFEVGDLSARWGFGRVGVELFGTAVRVYDDRSVFAEPTGGARPPDGDARVDVGAFGFSTAVRLVDAAAASVALRFGTRLPTTDNRVGLDRDRTDVFSTVAARFRFGGLDLGAEAGVSINGTRDDEHEQVDPLVFAVRATRPGRVAPFLELVGQHDTRRRSELRGTENLGEGRIGVRAGAARWVDVWAVRGWTRTGPELGLGVRVGVRF